MTDWHNDPEAIRWMNLVLDNIENMPRDIYSINILISRYRLEMTIVNTWSEND